MRSFAFIFIVAFMAFMSRQSVAACQGSAGPACEEVLTSGTTFTAPSWVDSNTVTRLLLVGGGGGGGGNNATTNIGGGGGSGAVCVVIGTGLLAASTGYTYAIGALGSGSTTDADAGSAGGNTTFTVGGTTYTADGGSGGEVGSTATNANAGGGAANCTINNTGDAGLNNGQTANDQYSYGGGGRWGLYPFGMGGSGSVNVQAATGLGVGGSGGVGTAALGNAGTAGEIIVYLQGE